MVEEVQEEAVLRISVTDPEEPSLVTQMLPEPSATIPTGEEKYVEPEKVVQEVEEQGEVAPDLISVTDGLEALSSVTQMLPEPSATIPTGEEKYVPVEEFEKVAQ